jgi:hypothetical protein
MSTPDHPARIPPDALAAECDFVATRRSGPGGQNRNKVETAVILTHRPTGISAEAAERRTQGENRGAALFRLRLRLALEVRCPAGGIGTDAYHPTDLWARRCHGGRISHSDFPAVLSEALDILAENAWDPRRAAQVLGCTASQLIKLLKDEPRALALVNDRRHAMGLHALQ